MIDDPRILKWIAEQKIAEARDAAKRRRLALPARRSEHAAKMNKVSLANWLPIARRFIASLCARSPIGGARYRSGGACGKGTITQLVTGRKVLATALAASIVACAASDVRKRLVVPDTSIEPVHRAAPKPPILSGPQTRQASYRNFIAGVPAQPAPSQRASIVAPGHALGPVTLGMRGVEADSAAAQFARTTGRVIDVLFQDGLVVAAGTATSTPIDLQVSKDTGAFLLRDAIGGQRTLKVNGLPDQLVNAFGAARVVREGHDELALIFAGGLVAEIRQTQARGGTVTYLAVQGTNSKAVPALGNLAPWIEGATGGVAVTYLSIHPGNSMLASDISHPSPWSVEPTGNAIVPGRSIGPVALGMLIQKAREAASTFEKETRCNIDLLAANDAVIAIGTPWAACLNLQLPHQTAAPVVGIGSPPVVLADMYGVPWIVQLGVDRAAHIFTDGLLAHVGALHVHGGFVTYLAVQPRGWRTVPTIGHFIDWSRP